jgi:hypothetical protein
VITPPILWREFGNKARSYRVSFGDQGVKASISPT